ncbi:MAG: hypothetical protein HY226_00095 [Candidatus Vogelbacteria bacterium]|nr:hypothetical protein [Candidatus Vogelbacteria bacterium]
MIITSITLVNYPKFSNKLSLDLLAEDIALSVRQAQIYGSSVLGARSGSGTTKAFSAYGVHFDDPANYPTEYNYILFADINGSRTYNGLEAGTRGFVCPLFGGPVEDQECLQIFKVTGFNRVRSLCLGYADEVPDQRVAACDRSDKQIGSMDIVFIRPNLNPKFSLKNKLGIDIPSVNVSNVGIILESSGGEYTKTIVIWKTGQISVE